MNSGAQTRWKRIETLFHQALDLTTGERESFLSNACASDSELREEL